MSTNTKEGVTQLVEFRNGMTEEIQTDYTSRNNENRRDKQKVRTRSEWLPPERHGPRVV